MFKRLMSWVAYSVVSVAILSAGPARSQGKSPTQQEMLDSLVGHEAPSAPGASRSLGATRDLGASRSLSLGAPAKSKSPQKRAQKQFMRKFLQRSMTRSPALPGPKRFNKNRPGAAGTFASTTSRDREQLVDIIKQNKLPAIDLEIYFDYNSAEISPRSVPDLVKLGQVLRNPKLAGAIFLVAGHTDAKGGARYNLSLSERRAQAVQEFLRASFGIKRQTLVPVGYGEEQLKDRYNPFGAQNRRVQIVNLSKMK